RCEHVSIARLQILRRDLRCECRQAQCGIETAGGEWRDGARRVADQQPALVRDASKDPADWNQTAAALDHAAVASDTRAKLLQRRRRIEAIAVPGYADMLFRAVVNDPRDVAGREARVEETVHGRRAARQHVLDADQKLFVAIELQLARDERASAVRADDEPRAHPLRPSAPRDDGVGSLHAE